MSHLFVQKYSFMSQLSKTLFNLIIYKVDYEET